MAKAVIPAGSPPALPFAPGAAGAPRRRRSGLLRVLTAAVLVPAAIAAVIWAPRGLFAGLLFGVAALAQWEFYGLLPASRPYRWWGIGAAAAMAAAFCLPAAQVAPAALLVAMVAGVAMLLRSLPEANAQGVAAGWLGLFYPALLLELLALARRAPGGREWILILFGVVWLGDTAAYYVGRKWGHRPMAPRLSPKKTWEGAAASLAAAVVTGALLTWWFFALGAGQAGLAPRALALGAGLGLALNFAAQAGDLVESAFKRAARVKDSGRLLPGHGGVLDRVDALLLAAPVLWWFLAVRF